ncbi:MAG TPA: hypothetical protein VEQ85_10505 [Lacipirellulaceae bacterium]|nr:hypothetical protein [Lacipirellulaceae bacterium]
MTSLFERAEGRTLGTADEQNPRAATGHALVAQIELTLDAVSAAVSVELDALLDAAAGSAGPPPAMIAFLERMFDGVQGDGERRKSARASLLATLVAVPLTTARRPCGEPFKGVARDASAGGLSLLHTRAVTSELLALRWPGLGTPGRQITQILRVQRCHPLGPFYEVAGSFLPVA